MSSLTGDRLVKTDFSCAKQHTTQKMPTVPNRHSAALQHNSSPLLLHEPIFHSHHAVASPGALFICSTSHGVISTCRCVPRARCVRCIVRDSWSILPVLFLTDDLMMHPLSERRSKTSMSQSRAAWCRSHHFITSHRRQRNIGRAMEAT